MYKEGRAEGVFHLGRKQAVNLNHFPKCLVKFGQLRCMDLNYYTLVRALFIFKDRLSLFRTNKNDRIVSFFEETTVNLEDEEAEIPDVKEISIMTGIPKKRIRDSISDLYLKTLESFRFNPILFKKTIVTLSLSMHWEEFKNMKNREFAEELREKTLEVEMEVSSIPRVGDTVHFDFIDDSVAWNYGHVYNIKHDFSSGVHNIIVFAHPFENHFHEWQRLKKNFKVSKKILVEARTKSGFTGRDSH